MSQVKLDSLTVSPKWPYVAIVMRAGQHVPLFVRAVARANTLEELEASLKSCALDIAVDPSSKNALSNKQRASVEQQARSMMSVTAVSQALMSAVDIPLYRVGAPAWVFRCKQMSLELQRDALLQELKSINDRLNRVEAQLNEL